MPDTLIEVRDLWMRYGSTDVLRGVTFDVHRGEVVCLLGPNGAGKTTTVEVCEGFRQRSGGHVRVLDVDPVAAAQDWRADVGVVLQSWRDHGKRRIRELLAHLGGFYTAYGTADRARPWDVDSLLAAVGLDAQADQKIATLPGGQRRRLDVAIGIVGRPKLLFCDEPTAGFDPEARRDFHDLIHRLSDEEDTTIFLTTHDLAEAETVADRILILNHGVLVAEGSADALARQVARTAEVRWSQDGKRFVHTTEETTAFLRELLAQPGADIEDLEIRRSTLEDTYLALVAGDGQPVRSVPTLQRVV